tara:strand:+ start:370 stop:594 length:225 start_codon:yes stop_codon:yes gene_type:complete
MDTSDYNTFTKEQINSMNLSSTWRHTLSIPNQKSESRLYKLHATGDADLNGRKYISLPADMEITKEVKERYNII